MILFVEIITKQSKSTSEGPIHQLSVLLRRKKRICKYANMVRVVVTTHYSEGAGLHAPKAVFSLTCGLLWIWEPPQAVTEHVHFGLVVDSAS